MSQGLGDHLAFVIARSGMPVAEMAERIGVTSDAVYQWMTGKCVPRADHLAKLLHHTQARDGVWLSAMRCLVDDDENQEVAP